MTDNIKKLSDPFPPQRVSWRVGRVIKPGEASALCYIDARDVMERLDEAVGPGNWQDSYCETPKGRVICNLQVRVGDAWVSKSDGAGDTAVEAEKGALSDAFKRAAVKWGIGRYLYDIPTQYVKIDEKKRILKSETGKLERALPGSRVADDGEPDEPGNGHATNGSKPPAADDEQRRIIGAVFREIDPPKWAAQLWTRNDYKVAVPETHEGKDDWPGWLSRMVGLANVAPNADAIEKLRAHNKATIDSYALASKEGGAALRKHLADRIDALLPNKMQAAE